MCVYSVHTQKDTIPQKIIYQHFTFDQDLPFLETKFVRRMKSLSGVPHARACMPISCEEEIHFLQDGGFLLFGRQCRYLDDENITE